MKTFIFDIFFYKLHYSEVDQTDIFINWLLQNYATFLYSLRIPALRINELASIITRNHLISTLTALNIIFTVANSR